MNAQGFYTYTTKDKHNTMLTPRHIEFLFLNHLCTLPYASTN